MIRLCSVEGCDRKYQAKGYCIAHYHVLAYWDKHLEIQRHIRATTGNRYTRKYEKTKKGFLMRLYRNMQSRIEGVQKKKFHLYRGKKLLPRQEFYDWSLTSPTFHVLFEAWEAAAYNRRLTPSVDRLDSSKGYTLDNMEWVTHSENSRRSQ